MARTGVQVTDPRDPAQIAQAITELQQTVDSKIEFGNPQDPAGPTTTLAGSGSPTTHNGQLMNIRGSWVEVEFETADTAVTCNHNLSVPVTSGVNVRWIVMGIRHSGAGANAASTLSVNFEDGDTIGENTIQLRAYAGGARTVNADNPIRFSLFFIPANDWPD